MRIPTDLQREQLAHIYDPKKAHDYYERHKHLKGRHHGSGQPSSSGKTGPHNTAKAKQKHELQAHITYLSKKLLELENLIQIKEAALKRSKATANANSKAKGNKPQTAAEKSKAKRDAKKYRQKHHQQLKNKAKQASKKSGGGSSNAAKHPRKASISELKSLVTKVKGQLAVAKQKLAAL
jgi:Tfp pilus assembly protein FimV